MPHMVIYSCGRINTSSRTLRTSCSVPDIKNRVSSHNSQNPRFRYEFGSWYELIDASTNGGGNIEFHFGLLHTDMTRKPAYAEFQLQVSQYGF